MLLVEVLEDGGSVMSASDCSQYAVWNRPHLDLPDAQVEESHALSDFDDGLGSDATHRGTETTIELENGELVEDGGLVGGGLELGVGDDLLGRGRLNAVPLAVKHRDRR